MNRFNAQRALALLAATLDYVPLPESLVRQIHGTWKTQVKGMPAM